MDTGDKLSFEMTKFRIACQQFILINNHINMLEIRYNRAILNDNMSFAETLKFQVDSVKSVLAVLCVYITVKCEEIDKLADELMTGLTLDDLSDDDRALVSDEL